MKKKNKIRYRGEKVQKFNKVLDKNLKNRYKRNIPFMLFSSTYQIYKHLLRVNGRSVTSKNLSTRLMISISKNSDKKKILQNRKLREWQKM